MPLPLCGRAAFSFIYGDDAPAAKPKKGLFRLGGRGRQPPEPDLSEDLRILQKLAGLLKKAKVIGEID